MIRKEIELLNSKLISGDLEPIVAEMFFEGNMDSLYAFVDGGDRIVPKQEYGDTAKQESDNRPSLKDWASKFGVVISV